MLDRETPFGVIHEFTSREMGARQANIAMVTLWGPDVLHYHEEAEETYFCLRGAGKIFLENRLFLFLPGQRIIIPPGTLHASRPLKTTGIVEFLCVSSPAFDPKDVYEDPRGWSW